MRRVVEGEEGGGLAEEVMDLGGGENGGEGREEELVGEERGGERGEREDLSGGGEDGGDIRIRVLEVEERVEVDEEGDALDSGEIQRIHRKSRLRNRLEGIFIARRAGARWADFESWREIRAFDSIHRGEWRSRESA